MSEYLGFQPVSEEYINSGKEFYFISYNSQDINYITPIVLKLHEMGVPLWYDYGIPYNSKWTGVIVDKIKKCRAVLFFLTWGIVTKVGPNGDDPYTMKEYKIAKAAKKEIFVNAIDQINLIDEFGRIPDDKVEFILDIEDRQSIPIFKNPENLDWITKEICKAIEFIPANTGNFSNLSDSFQIENGVLQKFIGSEKNVLIPDTVTSIGEYAFSSCQDVTNVILSKNTVVIGASSFKNCISLTNIIIPNGVTKIESRAFESCEYLTSITIPQSVVSIDAWAFSNCKNLTNISIPDSVTSIGDSAFFGCYNLIGLTLSNNITNIGWSMFCGCQKLTSAKIPDGVTSIGDYAFKDCKNLTRITVPSSISVIGKNIFLNCYNLKEIFYAGTKEQLINSNIDFGLNVKINYAENVDITPLSSFQIENGVLRKYIGAEENVTVPKSVVRIGYHSFFCCQNLISVIISEGTKSISIYSFSRCEKLTSITIPKSVTCIENGAFLECNLKSIFYKGTREQWNQLNVQVPHTIEIHYSENYDIKPLSSFQIENGVLRKYVGTGKNTIVPNSVVRIGYHSFSYCHNLISVVISEGTKSISVYSFYKCENLASITIPRSVICIENGAFEECNLKEIFYNGTREQWNQLNIQIPHTVKIHCS